MLLGEPAQLEVAGPPEGEKGRRENLPPFESLRFKVRCWPYPLPSSSSLEPPGRGDDEAVEEYNRVPPCPLGDVEKLECFVNGSPRWLCD
jgi:hypothetical protein